MKRFIALTISQGPSSFGEKGSSARVLVDADLIQLVREEAGRRFILLGSGLGEIEVKESFDKLRRILCETPAEKNGNLVDVAKKLTMRAQSNS